MVRAEPARIVAALRARDPHLHHLDGRVLLGPDEADNLPDGFHPPPHTAAWASPGPDEQPRRFATHAVANGGPFR
ncbi:hypothetical protein [Streptomyces bluensis]|uniref:hypothetical protein n=1 Tax=Streptomyces bluensis TaxID=33897 RepID=UPI003330DC8E